MINPSELEYMLKLRRNGWTAGRIAKRMDKLPWQVKEIFREYDEGQAKPPTEEARPRAPSAEELTKFRDSLDPVGRALMDLTTSVSAISTVTKDFVDLINSAMQPEEIEEAIQKMLYVPRSANETSAYKLARLLVADYIIIPRPKDPPKERESDVSKPESGGVEDVSAVSGIGEGTNSSDSVPLEDQGQLRNSSDKETGLHGNGVD